ADAGDDAADEIPGPRMVEAAEAQRVEIGDRTRAHREDVAQDAADAGGRALVRFDERRVIVALDLEGDPQPLTDIDHASVLPRPLQHARPLRREVLQEAARALVAAVFRPHDREYAELDEIRRPAEALADASEFVGGQAVRGSLNLGDRGAGVLHGSVSGGDSG